MGLFGKKEQPVAVEAPLKSTVSREVPYLVVSMRRRYYSYNLRAKDLAEAGVPNADQCSISDFVGFLNTNHWYADKTVAFHESAILSIERKIETVTETR